jgi:hypothetical protein
VIEPPIFMSPPYLANSGSTSNRATTAPFRRSLADSAALHPAPQTGVQPSWMGRANPWFCAAYDALLDGAGASLPPGKAPQKAKPYVLCLVTANGFDDKAAIPACAQGVDPDYPSYPWDE